MDDTGIKVEAYEWCEAATAEWKRLQADIINSVSELHDPWYNEVGDSIVCLSGDDDTISTQVNDYLTIYTSVVDSRFMGFKISNITNLLNKPYGL